MRIADAELGAVGHAFLLRETARGVNENGTLINAESFTRKIAALCEKTDDRSRATNDLQDLSGGA